MSKKRIRILQMAVLILVIAGVFIIADYRITHRGEPEGKGEVGMSPQSEESRQGSAGSRGQSQGSNLNRLVNEQSPYLLQHADNPVDWYPWGEEAFAKARRENKPIFLSIGYSTCHWCHVMEHESFEDPQVAALMNDAFVCIKVDREERPDIDNIYMTVCQMISGRGGWPLTIIMTPDKKPFFAATYIPKENRFGNLGMLSLVPKIKEAWISRNGEVISSADQIVKLLREVASPEPGETLGEDVLTTAFNQLASRFDDINGGFGQAPKFPVPHNILFLLRYWKRTGDAWVLEMVEKTLQKMRLGGIYDHVGFGFHRYSTDAEWFLPHFEKMLYDQAMIALAYTEAYQVTKKPQYRKTAEELFTYVLRDMTSGEGGFYCAEDADSEGEEGKFYLWTQAEVRKVLDAEEAELAVKVFNLKENGNYMDEATRERSRSSILYLAKPLGEIAEDMGVEEASLASSLETVRGKLFAYREKRVHPLKDDKILTDWNGLMIASLARASRVFDESKYLESAKRAADFILRDMTDDQGRLLHRYRGGEASLSANVDDYAFFIWGLLELYHASFGTRYLEAAIEFNSALVKHFWDDQKGGFYFTPDYGERLLVRSKKAYDGAVPSGNSVAMMNLLQLGRLTVNPGLEKKAEAISEAFSLLIAKNPAAHTCLMCALDFVTGPSLELVIVGKEGAADTRKMLEAVNTMFLPGLIVIFKGTDSPSDLSRLAGFTKKLYSVDGKATAYLCRNYACDLPTTNVEEMIAMLR